MFNFIESDALMDVCRALGLCEEYLRSEPARRDVFIVRQGLSERQIELGGDCLAFRLSDYLLATAPVDVKEA